MRMTLLRSLLPNSSEEEILKQIKADVQTALDSGGAKEFYDNDNWNASKGRVTKWDLYALMSEVSCGPKIMILVLNMLIF